MQVLSILQDESFEGTAHAKNTTKEEEVGRVNNAAVFEYACGFIVMKSLPGWIDEICTEHLQSVQFGAWRSGFPYGCAVSASLADP